MTDEQTRPWEKQLREAGARVEEDLQRLVTYLNDEVVPDVRRSGSTALRAAAIELQRLAEQLDDRRAAESKTPVPEARPEVKP